MPIAYSLRAASGQEYPVTGPFRIGREPECQIQIDNNRVSRIHASIWIDKDHLLLRDEGSRNGTQLNGQALPPGEPVYLHHDDELRVGGELFTVVSHPPYPRPRQQRGLPALPEDEPPPTAHLDKSGPAPAPPLSAAAGADPARATDEAPLPVPPAGLAAPPPPAAPARSRTVPLVIGGCLLLALFLACCALSFFAITTAGPAVLTAIAPAARTATPAPANAAGDQTLRVSKTLRVYPWQRADGKNMP